MNFSALPEITGGRLLQLADDKPLAHLLTDSRKPVLHEGSCFFAITGERHDGHDYIRMLYEAGINQFVVEKSFSLKNFPVANVLLVDSAIEALQKIVAQQRGQFSIPVIGITGSNGKTIVKEWLYQLLAYEYTTVKNPGSYNSQIGVPLSVWHIQPHHQLGIFEAGVSRVDEMMNLRNIIQPTYGIFTTIGSAHDENFTTRKQKIEEKLKLFSNVSLLVYCKDQPDVDEAVSQTTIPTISWGEHSQADIAISNNTNKLHIHWPDKKIDVDIQFPFSDAASVENATHCIIMMLVLGYVPSIIQQRVTMLRAVPMRLELKEGINQCQVIDDTYNNDLAGLQMSLDFLRNQHQKRTKTIILSDILESGLNEEDLANRIAAHINASGATRFIGIGKNLSAYATLFTPHAQFYSSTEEFIESFTPESFQHEMILIKGARVFAFEKIVSLFQKKVHGTVMEINLGALVHNLNEFRAKLKPRTKLMVMVKAFAYGSGSVDIANVLQFHKVDYLGVAYADEGVELRTNNITLPVMVMNPSPDGFQSMTQYNLEPELYSFTILEQLLAFLNGRTIGLHLKLDTGMHRLGFEEEQIDALIEVLQANKNIRVVSIFTHLVGSDEKVHDEFSTQQVDCFLRMTRKITHTLNINPILHVLNTSGIMRFPDWQFDMVRLGIGLYGANTTEGLSTVKPVATLKTVISQIKKIKKGESIGYSRKDMAEKDMTLATIAIGYADGFSRAFSCGVGEVLIKGERVRVVGNVCMDMTMIDVTGMDVHEGEDVIIFGNGLPVEEVAARINTIPYEILTNTSERIKRIFVAESM
ncbi:MAG: bifunctional UDP-N-acetylmuramoyl-tripeptide:D-alanyl-D-alanine ligase/alanine racemase [Cyclobacteriaceae bacterium]|nr:bifunctional UDP-N-acetylmuramoyl-tripeptide:D-alanyl-D-alanine ligase/alanine racemase [Cyclobacteriaceae bacterium]